MTSQEKYQKYFDAENAKALFKLVSELSKEERAAMRPFIIKIYNQYCIWNYKDGHSHRKGSMDQIQLIYETGVLVLTKKEFTKHFSRWFFMHNYDSFIQVMKVEPIEWLSKVLAKENSFSYLELMNIRALGYFEPSVEDLTARLANAISYYCVELKEQVFTPNVLTNYPETLSDHIWKLFEYETEISWTDGRYQTEQPWKNTFKDLIKNKKLDRIQVLTECLHTANRNFNKHLTGWFFDLFVFLEPTDSELLTLQPSLFNALTSPQSKVVNGVLKIFKKLGVHPEFQLQDFIDYASVLLTSETKGIVKSTLMIFDKIASKNKKYRGDIIHQATIALSSPHKDIQIRTAKVILKHGDTKNTDLVSEISSYGASLLSDSKKILVDFLADMEEIVVEKNIEIELLNNLSEDRKIPNLFTEDDFVFLASEVFDNNEAYHLDQFLAGIIQFQDSFQKAEFLEKLAPSFQRAYKTVLLNLRATQGYLDWHLALFMIDFSRILVELYPKETIVLEALYQTELKKDLTRINKWREVKDNKSKLTEGFFNHWYDKNPYTNAFKRKMNYILASFKSKKIMTPFVSTPTHLPFWIDPLTFAERLKQGGVIDPEDVKLAIARLGLIDTKSAIAYVKKNLSGLHKELLLYCFGDNTTYAGKDEFGFFAQAYLNDPDRYKPFLALNHIHLLNRHVGNINFEAVVEGKKQRVYDYQKKEYYHKMRYHNYLRASFEVQDSKKQSVTQDDMVVETPMSADLMRMASLSPNNPESLFYAILEKIMYLDWVEAEDGRMLDVMGEILFELPNPIGKAGHCFLAAAFLSENKTIRSFAAEYWVKEVANDRIDNPLLGATIGHIESIEFCPIKRLTDLIAAQMLNISSKHSQALETMILAAIPRMSDTPIRNTKKILEILVELRTKNKSTKLEKQVEEKLKAWQDSSSIKKLLKRLLA